MTRLMLAGAIGGLGMASVDTAAAADTADWALGDSGSRFLGVGFLGFKDLGVKGLGVKGLGFKDLAFEDLALTVVMAEVPVIHLRDGHFGREFPAP